MAEGSFARGAHSPVRARVLSREPGAREFTHTGSSLPFLASGPWHRVCASRARSEALPLLKATVERVERPSSSRPTHWLHSLASPRPRRGRAKPRRSSARSPPGPQPQAQESHREHRWEGHGLQLPSPPINLGSRRDPPSLSETSRGKSYRQRPRPSPRGAACDRSRRQLPHGLDHPVVSNDDTRGPAQRRPPRHANSTAQSTSNIFTRSNKVPTNARADDHGPSFPHVPILDTAITAHALPVSAPAYDRGDQFFPRLRRAPRGRVSSHSYRARADLRRAEPDPGRVQCAERAPARLPTRTPRRLTMNMSASCSSGSGCRHRPSGARGDQSLENGCTKSASTARRS